LERRESQEKRGRLGVSSSSILAAKKDGRVGDRILRGDADRRTPEEKKENGIDAPRLSGPQRAATTIQDAGRDRRRSPLSLSIIARFQGGKEGGVRRTRTKTRGGGGREGERGGFHSLAKEELSRSQLPKKGERLRKPGKNQRSTSAD